MVRVSSRIVRVVANVLSLCHGSVLQTTYRRKSRRLDQYALVKRRSKERIQQVLQDGTFVYSRAFRFFAPSNHHTQICRKIGVLKPQEEFDGDTTKTKIVFVTVQFLYTILTYIPVKFCYESFYFHASFLLITMLKSIWNGASFYIEVFAVRYVRKFKRTTDVNGRTPTMTPDSTPSTSPALKPEAAPPIDKIFLKKELDTILVKKEH